MLRSRGSSKIHQMLMLRFWTKMIKVLQTTSTSSSSLLLVLVYQNKPVACVARATSLYFPQYLFFQLRLWRVFFILEMYWHYIGTWSLLVVAGQNLCCLSQKCCRKQTKKFKTWKTIFITYSVMFALFFFDNILFRAEYCRNRVIRAFPRKRRVCFGKLTPKTS